MPEPASAELNVGLLIRENIPGRLAECREERDRLVEKVLELNQEMALLETHLQVGSPLKREENSYVGQ